jgi:hypothetical protein
MNIRRSSPETKQWLYLLMSLILLPIVAILLFSWLIAPAYLDRSFSLITPAYILFLAWGLAHPPYRSPLPLLYAGLVTTIIITLGYYYAYPDPAKPPFRQVGVTLNENWQTGDVLLNLHDGSYLPLVYYAPDLENYLLNNDPDTWIPGYTWDSWAGQRVDSVDEAIERKTRLWVVIVPRYNNPTQLDVQQTIEATYPLSDKIDFGDMQLYLYNLYPDK